MRGSGPGEAGSRHPGGQADVTAKQTSQQAGIIQAGIILVRQSADNLADWEQTRNRRTVAPATPAIAVRPAPA
jgi:hypothetical protein